MKNHSAFIKVYKRKLLFLFLCLFLLSSCSERVNPGNYPLEPDGPAPDPHKGNYVCEYGSLSFNGDGESLTIVIGPKITDLFELSEGEYEGSYVFLSGNLPPNGSFPIRYDAAHELQIDIKEIGYSRVFDVGIASPDGKSGTVGLDMVSEEKIPFLFYDGEKYFDVVFIRE